MHRKKLKYLLLVLLVGILSACSCVKDKPLETEATPVIVNDFPTQDRVEFVLECVAKHNGLRYETLYPCICSADKLASLMSYQEYSEAKTFTYLRSTPGEKGGVFRDPPQAKLLRNKLKDALKTAEESCFVQM